MRAEDLDHEELLELDPEGGGIRCAGQRALLLDAVAMGFLRKYLVDNFGTRQQWGDQRAAGLHFFDGTRRKECLDVSLNRVTETLKVADQKLREHRQALVRVAGRSTTPSIPRHSIESSRATE